VKTQFLLGLLTCFGLTVSGATASAQSLSPSDIQARKNVAPAGRKIADGVMTVVSPDPNSEDTALGPFDLDFVRKHPELEWAAPDFPENKPFFASPSETLLALSRDVTFRHEVWSLEFSFKPARLIEVDLPTATGQTERKVVWYMVYKVRYTGQDLMPRLEPLGDSVEVPETPTTVKFESVRFLPRFTIVSKERSLSIDAQILPAAREAIAARERIGKPLLDHIDIAKLDIKEANLDADHSVWGVATWTDVDPRLDFFAVDVRGLTNAYKIRIDTEGKTNYDRKTLRIYFWRPGDVLDVAQDRILLGLPALENKVRMDYYLQQFNLKERLDYQWIYR
jgi:hypothetical protein